MKTNDILSKFKSNNDKLEMVLAKKRFSGDVKNLLLSMQYKIITSYNDYANIKVNVENKNKFIENIIEIIKKCESIEIVMPNSAEGETYTKDGITSKVDTYSNSIRTFPTEKSMLFSLFKLNDTKMYLDEKYNIIRIALPELLNEGRDINNIEIIRDFNAWSWNTIPGEISNIDCNLIYQNLQILLGFEFLENWMNLEKQKELLEKLESKLKSEYNAEEIDEILDLIYRISIIICAQRNKSEKARLSDERDWDEKELEKLNNKEKLIIELTKTKKEKAKEIENIDKIINNQKLLEKEFEKRNERLSKYQKIYSIENLAGTMKKERRKALADIEECNNLLDAKNYIKRKDELEKNLSLLKEIGNSRNKEKYKIEIQKIFIKCLEEKIYKIDKVEQKKELIQLLNILRYYNFIVYDENRFIKDVEAIGEQLDELEEKIILKLFDFKVFNQITKDMTTNIKMVKPIFNSRIMNLENINIQGIQKEDRIEVNIYEGDILELGFEIDNPDKIKIKGKKKIKLFS